MPYKVKPKGGKFCVVKEGGAEVACHDDRPAALAQMKALYANEKAADSASVATVQVGCYDEACTRGFLDFALMIEHAETVHGLPADEAKMFTNKRRQKLASQGKAIPGKGGGAFPIENGADLMNAIRAYGRASDKAAAKAHIIRRAKALNLTSKLPAGWVTDSAGMVECPDCASHEPRYFLSEEGLADHAAAVHTFSDIEQLVRDEVREKWGQEGDYKANVPWIHAWVRDIAADWCVFELSQDRKAACYKVSYSIVDGSVTFGEPTEVVRRTVWDPVKRKQEDDD